jgi:FAD/FMN-containing dehydrogenase
VQGGITIDLSALKSIKVSLDKKTTEIGAGNRWGEVYSVLDQMGLSVVGGRVTGIGVGGLTLGGGVSFFSGRNGFACDNVRNYQVSGARTKAPLSCHDLLNRKSGDLRRRLHQQR